MKKSNKCFNGIGFIKSGKILTLKKGFRCSLHTHKIKDETFYILDGEVLMEVFERRNLEEL